MAGRLRRLAFAATVMCLVTAAAPAATIYFDDFNGSSSTNLNGEAPDTRPGTQVWASTAVASPNWKADGSIASNIGSNNASRRHNAFLPFTPEEDKVYELSIVANPNQNGFSGDQGFFALGFVNLSAPNANFENNVDARAWMLLRIDRTSDTNGQIVTYTGPDVTGSLPSAPATTIPEGPLTLTIVLDTRPDQWAVEWFLGDTLLREHTYLTNPTISYVGFGRQGGAGGTVDNFHLAIPEPASLGIVGLGVLTLLQRRRRYFG